MEEIVAYAFSNATNITNVIFPETLQTIRNFAFWGCGKLLSLKIGAGVSTIEPLFNYISGITKVTIDKENLYYSADENFLYNKEKTIIYRMLVDNETINIPEGIKEIGAMAFHVNHATSINIPSSVEKIRASFNYSYNLTKIDIPETVQELSFNAFENCDNLTEIRIHKQKDAIKGSPFGCPYGEKAIIWDT